MAEVLPHRHFGAGAGAAGEALPIGFTAGGHDGERRDEAHQRRIDGVDIEAVERPVADPGDEVARLIERGALRCGSPGEEQPMDRQEHHDGHAPQARRPGGGRGGGRRLCRHTHGRIPGRRRRGHRAPAGESDAPAATDECRQQPTALSNGSGPGGALSGGPGYPQPGREGGRSAMPRWLQRGRR